LSAPIYGLTSPAVILFTIVTNILFSAVLLRPSMHSATNMILVAMAQSDLFLPTTGQETVSSVKWN